MCVSVPLSIFVVSQCVSLCDSVLPLHVCVSQSVFQALFVCESHCVLLSQCVCVCVCVCISLYVYVSQCVSHSQFVCLRACLSECVSLSMCLSQCVCVALSESVSGS